MNKYDLMAEYHRGYEDGKKAKNADEWRLDFERFKVIQKLEKLPLDGDSYANLSAICGCIFTSEFGWSQDDCGALRDMLVGLLGGGNGTVGLLDKDVDTQAFIKLQQERDKLIKELRQIEKECEWFDIDYVLGVDDRWDVPQRLIYLLGGDNS